MDVRIMKRKKLITKTLTAPALALCLSVSGVASAEEPAPAADTIELAAASIPAFPGAEGAGMHATGGRGGSVYHVTNLNDSGAGSLRDAVSSSNRIVVFDVAGTINLKSDINCQSNITIAGQTAPGGKGITLKGGKFGMGGDNIIVRFISSRPGEKGNGSGDYDAWGGSKGSNSIIDHCSIGWANDEQFGLYSQNMNQTVQYSIIGPSNCVSYHSKGAHGFGAMFGKGQNSWHHNLICHSLSRNFRGKVVGTNSMDFVNNVIYDWGYQTAYGTLGRINYVNNTLKAGPSTKGGYRFINISSGTAPENYRFYMTGNRILNPDGSEHSSAINSDNWNGGINYGSAEYTEEDYRSDSPFSVASSTGADASVAYDAESANDAYENVLSYAGAAAFPADNDGSAYSFETDTSRNKIDAQVLYETRTGTGSLTGGRDFSTVTDDAVLSAIDTYGINFCDYDEYYPEAVLTKDIIDSDNDGMPDEWEAARGLDPNDASDATGDYLGEGYNNIEYYINDLTVSAFPEGVVTPSKTLYDLGEDYLNASDDAAAISLTSSAISKPSDLTLPTTGSVHGSKIEWSSSSKDVVIENNAITQINRPTNKNVLVSLSAAVTFGEYTVNKTFSITLIASTVSWTASSSDNGKGAGTELMKGLTNRFALRTKNDAGVTLDGKSFDYSVTGDTNGGWSDGKAVGDYFEYVAYEDGYLTAYATGVGETKTFCIVEEGVSGIDQAAASAMGTSGSDLAITARVEAGKTYYIFTSGSKGFFLGALFEVTSHASVWKAYKDISTSDNQMMGLKVSEDMSYTENNISIDGVGFTGSVRGVNNPSDNGRSGAAMQYTPLKDGTLSVYLNVGEGKTFRINDSAGNAIYEYANSSSDAKLVSSSAFLNAGQTYYFYVSNSKAKFYGLTFTPEPVSDPEPDTYISLSADGSKYIVESEKDATFYIAEYGDDGRLLSLTQHEIEGGSGSREFSKPSGDAKAFLWDVNNAPLCESI